MKQIALILSVAVHTAGQAGVLVVDNSPGSGAPYSNLQTAIDAAAGGDTIMIQPSPASYGNITITKQLVLIGPGHHAVNGRNASVGHVSLVSASSNSMITGCVIGRVYQQGSQQTHGIRVVRNYFTWVPGANYMIHADGVDADNWLIEGNVFGNIQGFCIFIGANKDNWLFRNNLFINSTSASHRLFNGLNSTTVFYHNVIVHRHTGQLFGGASGTQSDEAYFQNNIIWVTVNGNTVLDANCVGCSWVHNLTYMTGGTLDTLPGTTNMDNTDPQFVNVPASTFDFDNDYHCAPGSPGATGASDGGMLGIHGAGYPFNMNNLPEGIPRMLDMILDNVIMPPGTNTTVRVKATGGAD